jgi:hypothetical protein
VLESAPVSGVALLLIFGFQWFFLTEYASEFARKFQGSDYRNANSHTKFCWGKISAGSPTSKMSDDATFKELWIQCNSTICNDMEYTALTENRPFDYCYTTRLKATDQHCDTLKRYRWIRTNCCRCGHIILIHRSTSNWNVVADQWFNGVSPL